MSYYNYKKLFSFRKSIITLKSNEMSKMIIISTGSNSVDFIVFLWNFAHKFSLAVSTKKC